MFYNIGIRPTRSSETSRKRFRTRRHNQFQEVGRKGERQKNFLLMLLLFLAVEVAEAAVAAVAAEAVVLVANGILSWALKLLPMKVQWL
jgi:hypothetical protein